MSFGDPLQLGSSYSFLTSQDFILEIRCMPKMLSSAPKLCWSWNGRVSGWALLPLGWAGLGWAAAGTIGKGGVGRGARHSQTNPTIFIPNGISPVSASRGSCCEQLMAILGLCNALEGAPGQRHGTSGNWRALLVHGLLLPKIATPRAAWSPGPGSKIALTGGWSWQGGAKDVMANHKTGLSVPVSPIGEGED